jgi:hypothetical protein
MMEVWVGYADKFYFILHDCLGAEFFNYPIVTSILVTLVTSVVMRKDMFVTYVMMQSVTLITSIVTQRDTFVTPILMQSDMISVSVFQVPLTHNLNDSSLMRRDAGILVLPLIVLCIYNFP